MTTLSATIVPAAYSIDRKNGKPDAVYVAGLNGKPDGLYMFTGSVSEMKKRSPETLYEHVKKGAIRHVAWNGRHYLFSGDVEPPIGYWYLEEAVAATGYAPRWLRKLASSGILRKTYHFGKLMLCTYDVQNYAKLPSGRIISYKNGMLKYHIGKGYLSKLVSSGKVRKVEFPGGCGLVESDLKKATRPPRGYISDKKAQKEFSYSERRMNHLVATLPVRKIRVGRHVFLRRADLEKYRDRINSQAAKKRRVAIKPHAARVVRSRSRMLQFLLLIILH